MPFRELPIAARVYTLVNLCAGSALLVWALKDSSLHPDPVLILLLVLAVVSNVPKVHLSVQSARVTLSNIVVFLAVMLRRDPAEAAIVAGLSALAGTIVIRRPVRPDGTRAPRTWYKPALSAANLVESSLAASAVWTSAWKQPLPEDVTLGFLVALSAMALTFWVVNTGGIAVAVSLSQGLSSWRVWRDNFFATLPGCLCGVSAAACAAIMQQNLGFVSVFLATTVYVVYRNNRLNVAKMGAELRLVQELNELNERMISTLAMTIEAKDRYTQKHVDRVRAYAVAIARELGVSGPELEAVRIGAVVHDIGKIAVPEMILTKPGKLTPEEFERMKGHVLIGVKIMEAVGFPFPVTEAVGAHHERWDGNGYPHGLKGDEIPLAGRIVCLADGYDALTSDRHYRKAMEEDEVHELIMSQRGRQYDPQVVDALFRALPKVKPVIVSLNQQEWQPESLEGHPKMLPQEALQEIAHAAEEAVVLAEISLKPNVSHSPQEVIDLLLEKALLLLPATTGAVFLVDTESQELEVHGHHGLYTDLLDGLGMKVGEGVSGWVAANNMPARNTPAAGDLARRVSPGRNLELSSALSVPLQIGGTCIGAITLYHTGYNLFTAHHQRVLTTLAEHASSALETVFRIETNQVLAHTDSLTGLPNMRYLIQHLEGLTAQPSSSFVVLLLDLDGFKKVNDTLGHLEGDRVLRDVALILRESTRAEEDLVGRYAGDEFVIICHGRRLEEATVIADRVHQGFGKYRGLDGVAATLRASIGAACFPTDGGDWRALLSVADRRMYFDKLGDGATGGPGVPPEPLPRTA
ncbi:MAG TPA: HD domain-containing phosphohydrolase [Armatimonadota bacterium]|jgi:diguanylate cyclase (GGDEF)-like protein/putative nucleotidyltransferase with HDIG domain